MILPVDDEIELHLLVERHADQLFDLVDANRPHLREWLPWVDHERSRKESLAFVQLTFEQFQRNESLTTGVVYHHELVGVIGYHRIDWLNRATMMGYWLAEAFQGKGIITRAAARMTDHALITLGLHRLEIRCAIGNTRSCAIPRRLGFRWEGIARQAEWLYDHFVDLHVFAMLAPDWSSRQSVNGLRKGGSKRS